jgi:hypothetical protein
MRALLDKRALVAGGCAPPADSLNHAASLATSYRCGRGPAELRFEVRMVMSDSSDSKTMKLSVGLENRLH